MSRRGRNWLAGFVVLATVLGSGALGWSAEKVVFNTDWVFYGRDLGWFVAKEKGYFSKAGLDVDIVRGFGSGDSVKKIASGTQQYGNVDLGTVVKARATQDLRLKAISSFHDRSLYVIFSTKDRGIQTPKDLEGKTIGIARGSALHELFPALAAVNNIDASKVKWVFMNAPATIPSILGGKIDATLTFNTIRPAFQAASAKAKKSPVAILWSNYGLDVYSSGIIATDQTIQTKAAQTKAFVGAAMRGIAFAIENPEEALDIFMKVNPTSNRNFNRATWKITVEHMLTPYQKKNGLGQISKAKMEKTRDIITQHAKLPKSVPVSELYTNEFLPKLFPKPSQ